MITVTDNEVLIKIYIMYIWGWVNKGFQSFSHNSKIQYIHIHTNSYNTLFQKYLPHSQIHQLHSSSYIYILSSEGDNKDK